MDSEQQRADVMQAGRVVRGGWAGGHAHTLIRDRNIRRPSGRPSGARSWRRRTAALVLVAAVCVTAQRAPAESLDKTCTSVSSSRLEAGSVELCTQHFCHGWVHR